MTDILIKTFIKNSDDRESYGKLAGWVGIVTNTILALVKFLVGVFTSSIAIMTDAANNLSDSASSIITVVGFKLSGMPADEEHPYGHARFEYISGLVVSAIVFVIGVQFLINSVKKIFNPEPTSFSMLAGILLLISILAKFWQAGFYKKVAGIIDSDVLIATSIDSRNDVITTIVVLVSSVVEYFTNFHLDGPMGAIVSLFVIYSGVELLKDTLAPLLGQAPTAEMTKEIEDKILSYPEVLDVHDLIVHNYGPEQDFATVHIEMPATLDPLDSHKIIDQIEMDFLEEQKLHIVIHLDPVDTQDPLWGKIEKQVMDIAKNIDPEISVHGFRIVKSAGGIRVLFDIAIPPDYETSDADLSKIFEEKLHAIDASYNVVITVDRSYFSTIN